ncbi:hypothetical protein CR513_26249, partial [Mucuna pruriens]
MGAWYQSKLGTKILFSTTCHPQTSGQIEMVNRILSQLLRFFIGKSLRSWEDWLPDIEFAYNRVVIGVWVQPITPLDLFPLPNVASRLNEDGISKAQFVKKLHEKARSYVEKRVDQYSRKANRGKKEKDFDRGNLAWVHLRKERFSSLRNSKLLLREDGPFKILKKINDNSYTVDMPQEYGCTTSSLNLMTNSLQEGEYDVNMDQGL